MTPTTTSQRTLGLRKRRADVPALTRAERHALRRSTPLTASELRRVAQTRV